MQEWVPKSNADRYVQRMLAEESVLHARYNDLLDLVIVRAELRPGNRVLDIGSGGGELATRIAERRQCEVEGLDPSAAMVAYARQRPIPARGSVTYTVGAEPFLNIPFEAATFDAVVTTYAFHHVEDARKPDALRELCRVLKPQGRLCIGDVCFRNKENKAAAFRKWSNELEEEHFVYLPDLEGMYAQNGLACTIDHVGPISYVIAGQKA